jgi:hypothetical protein
MNSRRVISRGLVLFIAGALLAVTGSSANDALTPELRQRVERLKVEAATQTDDRQLLLERLETLWAWTNAASLAGTVIPVDLPYFVAGTRNLLLGLDDTRATTAQISEAIARFTRELQIKEEMPDAIGSLKLSDSGPFVVGQTVTLSQTYSVGTMPMKPGGGVMVPQIRTRQLQTDDPAGEGYVTIACSNPDARFELVEPWANWRTFLTYPTACFRLQGTTLTRGDEITITFGDRSRGGPGLRLSEYSKDCLYLPVYVDLEGRGDMLSPEWPYYQLVGRPETAFVNAIAPSIVAPGERFGLAVRSEDRSKNPVSGLTPAYEISLDGGQVATVAPAKKPVTVVGNLTVDRPGVYRFQIRSADGEIVGTSNPVWAVEDPSYRIYWGDTHGHSRMADGQGSPEGYFKFGRDVARLDFLTLSEHDLWMDDSEWQLLRRLTERYLDPGNFTTFLGYEWTVQNTFGGHHNVYFRDPQNRRRVPHQSVKNLQELYAGLRRVHSPEDVLIIPHAHQAADWSQTDGDMERLTELTSGHGTFEWFSNKYLANGFVVGFIGSSDNHLQHPGYTPGTNRQLGGLAAVLAPANTPQALFDALRGRSCYATTGERIVVDVAYDGARMGEMVPEDGRRTVRCQVMGTAPIEAIDLVKNGDLIYSKGYLEPELASHVRVMVTVASPSDVFEGHFSPRGPRPWKGTIEVRGARLIGFEKPWFFNPATYLVERDEAEPNILRFDTNTRGRGKGLMLELDGVTESTELVLRLDTVREVPTPGGFGERPVEQIPESVVTVRVGELVSGPIVHEIPVVRHVDTLTAQLVPGDAALDQQFEYQDLSEAKPGDYYYVRVTQVDGAMAWSSPVWFGRPAAR